MLYTAPTVSLLRPPLHSERVRRSDGPGKDIRPGAVMGISYSELQRDRLPALLEEGATYEISAIHKKLSHRSLVSGVQASHLGTKDTHRGREEEGEEN